MGYTKPPKQRKFNVGYITRFFDYHKKYSRKSDAQDAADRLKGQRYYTRIVRVKGGYVLWKCKKPKWK